MRYYACVQVSYEMRRSAGADGELQNTVVTMGVNICALGYAERGLTGTPSGSVRTRAAHGPGMESDSRSRECI